MHREISSHSNIIRRVLDIMKAISSGFFTIMRTLVNPDAWLIINGTDERKSAQPGKVSK